MTVDSCRAGRARAIPDRVRGRGRVPRGLLLVCLALCLAGEAPQVAMATGVDAGSGGRGTSDRFVVIPAGTFVMGCPASEPGGRSYEQPEHEVAITRSFLMSATEVTQAQWQEVMGGHPSYFQGHEDYPVERVSWYEAVAYCNALSRLQDLEPAYAIAGTLVSWQREAGGYRLPTEAEWEYACRAGSNTIFHAGDCLTSDQANYNAYAPLPDCPEGMFRAQPVEVGSFPANAWGLYDMHGNLYEWCWDWNGFYSQTRVTDPTGPTAGTGRVFRGGCWAANAENCRCATRQRLEPGAQLDFLGFRVVRWAD